MRLSTACVLCVLLAAVPSVAAGPSEPDRVRDDVRQVGVEAKLSQEGVMALYMGLAAMPRLQQRAAVRNLTPETRVALWRYNITTFVNRKGELSPEQKAFLDEAHDGIRPSLFQNRNCDTNCKVARHEYLEVYKSRAEVLFEPDDFYRLFIRLGEEPLWPITAPGASAARSGEVKPDTLRECHCIDWYECWFAGEYCIAWECIPVMECGFWGSDGCVGLCA